MHIAPPDRTASEGEWRPFVVQQGFGHLVAGGLNRSVPAVVPTQFVLDADEIILHLVGPNPVVAAIREYPRVVMSVAGDWAYIPSDWKAIGDEDPALGIPTTYYAAVQLIGTATIVDDPDAIADILRRQLEHLQPGTPVADPGTAHRSKLRSISGVVIAIDDVRAKFKYGGNVDVAHRLAVAERLEDRLRPGDAAAAGHTRRRTVGGGH